MKTTITLLLALATNMASAQTFSWAKQLGGTLEDNNKVVTTDANGDVYTCGRFNGTADFDPGANTFNLTAGSSGAMFISKLDTAGDFVWARQIDGDPSGLNLAVGLNGSVYITGNFSGVVDVDPDAGVYNLTTTSVGGSCAPHLDIFILKLNADGYFMWAGQIGGTGDDYAGSDYHKAGGGIALGAYDAIYIGGGMGRENNVNIPSSPLVDFDPSPSNSTNSSVTSPSFVVKLDSSGTFDWVSTWEGGENSSSSCSNISSSTCHAIALDNSGNVYYTGKVGGWQAFVRKVSSTGALLWSATLAGSLSVSYDVAVDANGSVYTTGYFTNTTDFNPGTGTNNLKAPGSAGIANAFVWKLNAAGNYVWAAQLGGNSADYGYSIDLDASGNVYTTGAFAGTGDFNPASAKYNLISAGGSDAFVSKLNSSGGFIWAVRLGGTADDGGKCIDIDASNNVFTAGTFNGTADFNPSNATANLTSFGAADAYIHKMTQASLRMDDGVNESNTESAVLVYPNPARDYFLLNFSSSESSPYGIKLFDMSGRIIKEWSGEATSGVNAIELDIQSVHSGIYFLTITTGTTMQTQKLIVE